MTAEQQYIAFLKEHGLNNPAQHGGFPLITYKGFKCAAIKRAVFDKIHVEIRPLSPSWNIGNGAGAAVHKEFSRQPTMRLEPKAYAKHLHDSVTDILCDSMAIDWDEEGKSIANFILEELISAIPWEDQKESSELDQYYKEVKKAVNEL